MHLREHELYRVCAVEHGVEHGALRPVPLPVHSCIWSAGLASSCPLTSVHLSPCHLPPGICLFIHPLPIHPSSLCSPRAPLIQPSMHLRSHHLATHLWGQHRVCRCNACVHLSAHRRCRSRSTAQTCDSSAAPTPGKLPEGGDGAQPWEPALALAPLRGLSGELIKSFPQQAW